MGKRKGTNYQLRLITGNDTITNNNTKKAGIQQNVFTSSRCQNILQNLTLIVMILLTIHYKV